MGGGRFSTSPVFTRAYRKHLLRASYYDADFERAVDSICRDAGHYYLLGYSPADTINGLHRLAVTVRRPGLEVRARKARG